MTALERIARAIHARSSWPNKHPDAWMYYADAARAAVEAMREPTLRMQHWIACAQPPCPEMAWKAGIDAILSEEPTP